jgi:hypothetical protein
MKLTGWTEKRTGIQEAGPIVRQRPRFLRWALLTTLTLVSFAAAAASYHGHVHTVGKVSVAIVLTVFVVATAYCGVLAWRADGAWTGEEVHRGLDHVALAIRICPMLAMLGTASGFLIAFSGTSADVQQRVAGASTGIVATVAGVACTIVLMLQRHMLEEPGR